MRRAYIYIFIVGSIVAPSTVGAQTALCLSEDRASCQGPLIRNVIPSVAPGQPAGPGSPTNWAPSAPTTNSPANPGPSNSGCQYYTLSGGDISGTENGYYSSGGGLNAGATGASGGSSNAASNCVNGLINDCQVSGYQKTGTFTSINDCISSVVGSYSSGTYLTADCQTASNVPPDQVCDETANYYTEPISLLWEGQSTSDEAATLTQFPVDPSRVGKWFVWRASARTPLLVYDPDHTGVISSGAQLFGAFAFGEQWKDGYAALASLDRDGDGFLSGDELSPLALWFDSNMNGVAEPGEVVPLKDLGVTRVFVNGQRQGSAPGDIVMARGYERIVGGKVAIGASFDWFSASYDSPSQAVGALPRDESTKALASRQSDQREVLADPKNPLTGAWFWRIDGDDRRFAPKGAITLAGDSGGHVVGHSLVSSPLRKNKAQMSDVIISSLLRGEYERQMDGTLIVRFDVTAPDGSITRNVAQLLRNRKTMTGTSSVIVHPVKGRSETTTLTYTWTAKKVS